MQQVREIMTTTLTTLQPDATVADAATKMRDRGIGDVFVMDDSKLAGIVTDRDIVVRVLAEGRDAKATKLGEICSGEVATVSPDDGVGEVVRIVRERNVRRVPVTDGTKPVGVVSIGDLAVERDPSSAVADVSSAPANT